MSDVFDRELSDGEEILWAGQPAAWVILSGVDWLLIPITITIGFYTLGRAAFTFMVYFGSGGQRVSLLSLVGAVPFALVGLYLTLGRFIYKCWRKKHTYYAVTNKRVLVLLDRRYLMGEYIVNIPGLHVSAGSSGIGTVTLARSPFIAVWCGNTGMNCTVGFDRKEFMAFHDIQNARQVYALIERLRSDLMEYIPTPDQMKEINHSIEQLSSEDTEVVSEVQDHLVEMGAPAVELLIDASSDLNPVVRYRVATVLGKMRDSHAFDALLRLTHDPDAAVRYDALVALGRLGDPRGVAPLADVLRLARERGVDANAAANGLEELGEIAIPVLLDVLESGTAEARSAAAYTLGNIASDSAVEPLAELLGDEDEQLRVAAIESLASLAESNPEMLKDRCLELIEDRLQDQSEEVRDVASYWSSVIRNLTMSNSPIRTIPDVS